ncbi:16S rRNA (guanine(966)-N(2))-methyltransferase RsmD [Falsirhodobacter sp. alg1]|uniref:16S rRNA (guanine(966)-N(2))-methyltransferase RsmD n=1 Tax=Falsirhodobacter sp. alg1 TaxID=1472418 RepID=UPI0005F0A031|nr:16S rRNA (guanine(966)-N(2))-methyltransferase RsmD [Falsirhodobacter sp. alg1]
MRIVGGRARGTRLADVGAGDPAAHLRPTSDRVREAIFNLLINGGYGNPLQDARVLDLFAGTGAIGLEAISRGAAHTTFVDDGMAAQKLIRRNAEITRMTPQTDLLRRNATRLGPNTGAPYDLVFLDPPYGKGLGQLALGAVAGGGWLADGALVVWEEGAALAAPEPFALLDQRRYGETWVSILRGPEAEE